MRIGNGVQHLRPHIQHTLVELGRVVEAAKGNKAIGNARRWGNLLRCKRQWRVAKAPTRQVNNRLHKLRLRSMWRMPFVQQYRVHNSQPRGGKVAQPAHLHGCRSVRKHG